MASRPPEHRTPESHISESPAADPAKGRFFIIAFHRLGGAVLVMLGLLVTQHAIDWPTKVGWALIAVGLVDVFVMPQVFARMWRTPRA